MPEKVEPITPGPPALRFKGELPPMPRTIALPRIEDLPEKRQAMFTDKERHPRVRLLCFYGVADNSHEWMPFITEAPEWVEIAVFECKAHGVREEEEWDTSMELRSEDAWEHLLPVFREHALGGCVEGAPFGFMCHSCGAQLVTLLAKKLRELLHLEPCGFYIVDRPPANIRAISDQGYQWLCEDHPKFFEHFNANALKYYNKGSKVSDMIYMRWRNGMHLTQEFVVPEKWHIFDCPIVSFIATQPHENDKRYAKGSRHPFPMTPEEREAFKKRDIVLQSVKDSSADWDIRQYGFWRRWTKSGKAEVIRVMTDHSTCRFHPEVQEVVFRELLKVVEAE